MAVSSKKKTPSKKTSILAEATERSKKKGGGGFTLAPAQLEVVDGAIEARANGTHITKIALYRAMKKEWPDLPSDKAFAEAIRRAGRVW